jgi:hypothetical protein
VRKPNPRRLVLAILVVAFVSGSCTAQDVLGGGHEVPPQAELERFFKKRAPAEQDSQATERLASPLHAYLVARSKFAARFEPLVVFFGILLVVAYGATLFFGMRAWRMQPGAAKALSTVSLWVLPTRVAVAAMDLASARSMQPELREIASAWARIPGQPWGPDQADELARNLGDAMVWGSFGLQAAGVLAVCLLFSYAWRYFQRPDIIAALGGKPEKPPMI